MFLPAILIPAWASSSCILAFYCMLKIWKISSWLVLGVSVSASDELEEALTVAWSSLFPREARADGNRRLISGHGHSWRSNGLTQWESHSIFNDLFIFYSTESNILRPVPMWPSNPYSRPLLIKSKPSTHSGHQGQNLAKFSNVIYSIFSGLPHILSK